MIFFFLLLKKNCFIFSIKKIYLYKYIKFALILRILKIISLIVLQFCRRMYLWKNSNIFYFSNSTETEFSYINITKLLNIFKTLGIFSKITIFENTANIKFTPREIGIFPRTRRYKTFLTHRSFASALSYHLTMSQKSQLLIIWNMKLNDFNKKKFSNQNCTNKYVFLLYFQNRIISYQYFINILLIVFDISIILLKYHHYNIIINIMS